jgi:hypothetical protein
MLLDLQDRFRAAVLGTDDGPLAGLVSAPGTLAARIGVHRNTVQTSLVETLRAAFPVVERIVGAAFFGQIARAHVMAAPPRLPQLFRYGHDFADFLTAADAVGVLPYLPDVARLEWARNESAFAADATALDPAALETLGDDALAGLRLVLHPATRIVPSRFPIVRIWQVNQPEVADVPVVDMSVAEAAIVSRRDGVVSLRRVSAGDAAFVAALESRQTLDEAVNAAFGQDAGFDVQACLFAHLSGGTFSRCER